MQIVTPWKQWVYMAIGSLTLVGIVVLAVIAINNSSTLGDSKHILQNQNITKKAGECRSLATGQRIALLVDYVVSTRDQQAVILAKLRGLEPLIETLKDCNKEG